MNPPVGPILVHIGPVAIHWYGILVVAGVLAGTLYAARQASRAGISSEHIWDGLILCLILGLVGARLEHVFSTPAECTAQTNYPCGWPWYRQHPADIVKLWEGGLGIYGAILGGVLGAVVYARYHQLPSLRLLDLGGPGLALGQAIGRWGHFVNQELYGPPTGSKWFGLLIDAEHRLAMHRDLPADTLFHPTFLYESLWCLALFVTLVVIGRRMAGRLREGDLFAAYLVGYGLGRSWIDFFRPDAQMLGPLTTAQWMGLAFVAVGAILIAVRHRQGPSTEAPLAVEQTGQEA